MDNRTKIIEHLQLLRELQMRGPPQPPRLPTTSNNFSDNLSKIMQTDFNPHTEKKTVVYNSKGELITSYDDHVTIKPSDFRDHLPIEYHHITITYQINNIIHIDK